MVGCGEDLILLLGLFQLIHDVVSASEIGESSDIVAERACHHYMLAVPLIGEPFPGLFIGKTGTVDTVYRGPVRKSVARISVRIGLGNSCACECDDD